MKTPSILVVVFVLMALIFSCATRSEVDGQCHITGVCSPAGINAQPEGSVCTTAGVCMCPAGTKPCCASGPPGRCQKEPCAPGDTCPNDDGGPLPIAECDADADCANLGGTECKEGVCVAGKCEVKIKTGVTLSQRYGDCKRRECDASGAIVEVGDDSDYFDDVIECTIDFCKDGKAQNLPLAEGTPCGADGHCYQNACVECMVWRQDSQCTGNLTCDWLWCVPWQQCFNSCGGICAPCQTGSVCAVDADCVSLHCSKGLCELPSCTDGRKNGSEAGVDCGATVCGACPDGQDCHAHLDCLSQVCYLGKCQVPTCFDGVQNGVETGTDCGGDCVGCNL